MRRAALSQAPPPQRGTRRKPLFYWIFIARRNRRGTLSQPPWRLQVRDRHIQPSGWRSAGRGL